MNDKCIPEEWIKNYVNKMLEYANKLNVESPMGQACLLRADHAMDLVKAYRESKNDKS